MKRLPRALWRRRGVATGAFWAWQALRALRRDLKVVGLEASVAPPPSSVVSRPGDAAVRAVLTLGRATCLERALIVQRLLARAGRPRDVAIGVNGGAGGFEAHAWVEGHDVVEDQAKYTVLTRIAPG